MTGARTRSVGSHPLLRWLHEELPADPFHTIVVTTSEQAAAALRRGLLRRRPGLLGVWFVTATGLARTVLQLSRTRHPHRLPDPLLERETLRACLADHPGNVSQYAWRHPGALLRLLGSIKELESAGWPEPDDALSRWGRELRAIGATYRQRMAGWASRGRLMELALEVTADPRSGDLPARVLLTGYLHPERDVTLLLEHLRDLGVTVKCSPEPGDRFPDVTLHSTPDIHEELRLAARLCLEAARDGVDLADMVVAAPSLGLYTGQLRRAFAAEGVPFTAKAEGSLHEPRAAFHRHAASLLCEPGRRTSYMAVASSPLLRDPLLPGELDLFERLSRKLSLQGNAAEVDLGPVAAEFELRADVDGQRLLQLLTELRDAAARPCSTAADQVRRLRAFAGRVLAPPEDPRDSLAEQRISECLTALEEAGGAGTGGEFVDRLRDLFAQRGLPIRGGRGPGVTVVEHRDVLSFPAVHLHLLGLSAEQVPGTPAGELLEPRDREALPGLLSRADSRARQRQLLHLALRHPQRSLILSHPRSTGAGRVVNATRWLEPLLAELPRAVPGIRSPAHPDARARARVETGLCPADLALMHLALCRAPLRVLSEVAPADAPSCLRSRRLERFRSGSLAWDGDVGQALGRRRAAATLRVADLERIGRCPQQFLFARVMNLEPLPPETDPLDLRRDLLGSVIHRVLQEVQEEFLAEMAQRPHDLAPRMTARARELLEGSWRRDASILGPTVPALRQLMQARWADALARVIEADLDGLEAQHRRPEAIEVKLRATLRAARPGAMPVDLETTGRADRIDVMPDGSRVILDFKTGRRPDEPVDAKRILHGWHLQLPLYGMMLRAARGEVTSGLEIRPVHPAALRDGMTCLSVPSRLSDEPEGVLETVAVLGELLSRGACVPNVRHGPCGFCDFRLACRRLHPPSAERVLASEVPEVRRYLALSRKTASRPLLSAEDAR